MSLFPPIPSWSFDYDYVERWAFVSSAFSPEECQKIIDFGKSKTLFDAGIENQDNTIVDTKYRKSNIAFLTPEPEMKWIYDRLTHFIHEINEKCFKFDLWGLTEGLQFTEYVAPTGKYDPHIDKVYHSTIRKLSLVLQLTDDTVYEGGDLIIIDGKPETLPRQQGTLLFFPSYTLHQVTPVTNGTRHSLVGWITGKPFK